MFHTLTIFSLGHLVSTTMIFFQPLKVFLGYDNIDDSDCFLILDKPFPSLNMTKKNANNTFFSTHSLYVIN